MDIKTQYRGVRIRGNSIQIDFRFKGDRCKETLRIPPTATNLKKAANLLGKINFDIAFNDFNYAEYFPNSRKAITLGGNPAINFTVEDALKWWLENYEYKDIKTKKQHEHLVTKHIVPGIGDIMLQDLIPKHVTDWIKTLTFSKSSINNALSALRQMFEMAYNNNYVKEDIMKRVKSVKRDKIVKKPFTINEVDKLLTTTVEKESKYYNQFAFWTGLSSGEQVALKWGDINFDKLTVSIDKILTNGENKDTKGETDHRDRDVELVQPAYQALIELMPTDYFENTEKYNDKHIFLNPNTGRVWTNYGSTQRWIKDLKEAGIPYRKPYNTRQTYASIMLSACLPDAYLRSQMGHASMRMLEDVYGKFHNDAEVIDWVLRHTKGGHNGALFTKLFLDIHSK